MSVVYCKLPKAGLGNQLFPLMKSFTLAVLNNFPVIITGYHKFQIGPYLRGEKSKRRYKSYFKFQKSFFGEQLDKWFIKKSRLEVQHEPLIRVLDEQERPGKIYLFDSIPHWSDYFKDLRDHRQTVQQLMWDLLHDEVKKKVEKQVAPCIGVHIRMGDFRKLKAGEDFSRVGAVRTPEKYFIDVIQTVRNEYGKDLPVAIFTDGHKHEFEELFSLDNITMIEGNPDIVDLLLLSKSQVIITSVGSTFSYWSAFLSNAPVIRHPHHLHSFLRPDEVNDIWYEGPVVSGSVPKLLRENIRSISC